jgi:Arc/MetJ-type ribon-helix-helix transcriptional regulator
MSEEELARLDELARRMNRTRSDVIRDLITRFDEMLREEVEKERRRWMMIGFVAALESEILDPEVVLRFVRRNVDALGFPDFLIGMTRVRNRVVVFSHHDKVGHQLLRLVKDRVEEEVRREETEIEREGNEGEDVGDGRATQVRIPVSRPIKPSALHAASGAHRYKILVSSKSSSPIARPTAAGVVGKSAVSGGGGDAKATANASTPEKQKLTTTSTPTATDPVNPQTRGSNSQVAAIGSGPSPVGPVTQVSTGKPAGDFVIALVTKLYHKHRETLLRAVEAVMGG